MAGPEGSPKFGPQGPGIYPIAQYPIPIGPPIPNARSARSPDPGTLAGYGALVHSRLKIQDCATCCCGSKSKFCMPIGRPGRRPAGEPGEPISRRARPAGAPSPPRGLLKGPLKFINNTAAHLKALFICGYFSLDQVRARAPSLADLVGHRVPPGGCDGRKALNAQQG